MAKRRNGVFRVALRRLANELQAMKEIGWTWDMVAAHFLRDGALGNASGKQFANEWGVLCRQGLQISPDKVEGLVKQLKSLPDPAGLWVTRGPKLLSSQRMNPVGHQPLGNAVKPEVPSSGQQAATVPEVATAPSSEPEPSNPLPAAKPEESVVERHQLSAAAAGMTYVFPLKNTGMESPASSVPVVWEPSGPIYVLTPASRKELETRLVNANLSAQDLTAHFDFSPAVIQFAILNARHVRGHKAAFDHWVGRLAFHQPIERNETHRGEIARLPGFERWQAARQNGAIIYEKAVEWLQQQEKQQ